MQDATVTRKGDTSCLHCVLKEEQKRYSTDTCAKREYNVNRYNCACLNNNLPSLCSFFEFTVLELKAPARIKHGAYAEPI